MRTLTRKWTDAALMALPRGQGKYELIDGELTRMSPAGYEYGYIELRIGSAILNLVTARRLGLVYGPKRLRNKIQVDGDLRAPCSLPRSGLTCLESGGGGAGKTWRSEIAIHLQTFSCILSTGFRLDPENVLSAYPNNPAAR